MAEIINGKIVSAKIREQIARDVSDFKTAEGRAPGLAVIVVGDDPASAVYVRNKHKACLEVGITSYQIEFPASISEEELLFKIDELNRDESVNGILVQLPLPKHINESAVINRIDPKKDVDAFHPENVGRIMIGDYSFLPCTPAGIMALLDYYNVTVEGKRCVVIGRSNIVGKPMALLLLERNGTVTVCHSKTRGILEICREADIIVVAVGRKEFLKADMVKPGAVIIDVGINRGADGKLVGDVAFEGVSAVASMITPVPGGVGPMTITMLLQNTVTAARMQKL
nr:bifunctional methylenetetrahydrofolate dehydrogenase/methenyltetrahydrofolate cyclohydrolase FolD [Oscillospiraceae bacterium]